MVHELVCMGSMGYVSHVYKHVHMCVEVSLQSLSKPARAASLGTDLPECCQASERPELVQGDR